MGAHGPQWHGWLWVGRERGMLRGSRGFAGSRRSSPGHGGHVPAGLPRTPSLCQDCCGGHPPSRDAGGQHAHPQASAASTLDHLGLSEEAQLPEQLGFGLVEGSAGAPFGRKLAGRLVLLLRLSAHILGCLTGFCPLPGQPHHSGGLISRHLWLPQPQTRNLGLFISLAPAGIVKEQILSSLPYSICN